MTRATLSDVLPPALEGGYAVAGLVVLGWEDARAYVAAAEAEGAPVILQAGPGARAHTPLTVLGAMFKILAEGASVPVVSHLDHATTAAECRAAIDAGFTSVMYDGSRLPLAENIARTAEIVQACHAVGVSAEGEIGFVGYAEGAASRGTDPHEAQQFADRTGVDAMAVSIGNVHLQQMAGTEIDLQLLRSIEAVSPVPLVLHGGSGISDRVRRELATDSRICKINIGTELRQTFGISLRAHLAEHPESFDRVEILRSTEPSLQDAAQRVMRTLKPPG